MKQQVGSPMKWGLRWLSDDDDFFPDFSLYKISQPPEWNPVSEPGAPYASFTFQYFFYVQKRLVVHFPKLWSDEW